MALRRAPVPGARLMISDSTTKAGLRNAVAHALLPTNCGFDPKLISALLPPAVHVEVDMPLSGI